MSRDKVGRIARVVVGLSEILAALVVYREAVRAERMKRAGVYL
jgi:hypothetical protein